MISVHSVLFALVLFSEMNSHFAAAVPATIIEDDMADKDGLGLILRDDPMTELAVVPLMYRRNHALDNSLRDEDGSRKVITVSDMGLKGIHGLNSAFTRILPLLPGQGLSNIPAQHSFKIDRRDTDSDRGGSSLWHCVFRLPSFL
ncbi:pro-MCH isoform X2 [Antennarius striatus]|uniref:pro-MCH isoform X2 n=1 Tax=Antennarius striatus TaxID=241820 RepID=UPI0035B4342A